MAQLPDAYRQFQDDYAVVWQAYDQLCTAAHGISPLDEQQRA